jgi:FtsH-binding integral membrane protein
VVAHSSEPVQRHLASVYGFLLLGTLASAAGVYVHMLTNVGGLLTMLASFGVMWMIMTDNNQGDKARAASLFSAFAFFVGCGLGNLVEVVLLVDPSILTTAGLLTATVFACFSGSALLSRRRSYLYLGGTLASALSMLFWAGFLNMFLGSAFLFDITL